MSRDRCSWFMLKIASRIERAMPAARNAPKDEPYSTIRFSRRWYQTRWGTWCASGCTPVAIDVRQTGVSEGNTETPRAYVPFSSRKRRAGTRSVSTAASSTDGGRPSMTIRISFFLVFGKGAQPRVALAGATAYTGCERGECKRFDVADERNERERGNTYARGADERCGSAACAPAAQRALHDRPCAHASCGAADRAAENLVPVADGERDEYTDGDADKRSRRDPGAACCEHSRCDDAGADADAGAKRDAPQPIGHAASLVWPNAAQGKMSV